MKTLAKPREREAVIRRLLAMRADSPRAWGKMSCPQMVCHLSDSFRSMMGDRPITHVHYRRPLLYAALYLPLRWPKGIETRPEVDQLGGGTRPGNFADDVLNLQRLIQRFSSCARDIDFPPHPIFGPMSDWQWMRWGYLHCDHHLRQFGG